VSILVTGGAGYIGSHMVHDLADAGERVVVLDNLSTGFDWAVRNGVPLVVGDTGDQDLVGQILREYEVQSIIHFAASAIVPDSVKDPLGYYKNNTVNSRALIEIAVKNGVRQFIFSSTCAVYGNPPQVPVTEDTPAAPISPYGSSKLMTEIMLRDASAAHGLSPCHKRVPGPTRNWTPWLRGGQLPIVEYHRSDVAGGDSPGASQRYAVARVVRIGQPVEVGFYANHNATPELVIETDLPAAQELRTAVWA
jgi:NAD dependent epimerase/dehydratase family